MGGQGGLKRGQERGGKGRARKSASGQLGKALVNQQRATQRSHMLIAREEDPTVETERGKGKMRSVTDCDDLEDFMARASLANTDFTATERAHMVVLETNVVHTGAKGRAAVGQALIRLPRRPRWHPGTTPEELTRSENEAFLEWRRGLAELEEAGALLTPFERNLEVWRQLWRVLERSDLVVQIVDARNPLFFKCDDLDHYVRDLNAPNLGHGPMAGLDEGEEDAETAEEEVAGIAQDLEGAAAESTASQAGTSASHLDAMRIRASPAPVRKRSLLLLNKADLLPPELRERWAAYFRSKGVRFAFFSALAANEEMAAAQATHMSSVVAHTAELADDAMKGQDAEDVEATPRAPFPEAAQAAEADTPRAQASTAAAASAQGEPGEVDEESAAFLFHEAHVYNRDEILALLLRLCPERQVEAPVDVGVPSHKVFRWNVGFVGYPNVGKSSTINALCSSKKVSVSATPGKTKHFQTLSCTDEPDLLICDCPGLVFPNLAGSRAQMYCDGVLPVDQMRDHHPAVEELCARVPRDELERTYGITLATRDDEEDPIPISPARELLVAHGIVHSFLNKGGQPDESRSARLVLKDLINGRLRHWQTPPDGLAQHDEVRFAAAARGTGGLRPPLTIDRYINDRNHDAQEDVVAHAVGGNAAVGGRAGGKKARNRRQQAQRTDSVAAGVPRVVTGVGPQRLPDRLVATGPSVLM
mmetsp:Transcript_6840/g.18505  ORF Transcript_6840/g.18505 Transcript_6840/m.18505 type:complete len:705 (-) Transcript_6840:108-2222(-)